jgi:alkanesulfonate monooxygenase SsuD/methylene tetrahydromethanopterin reductase-like flavin-dependent oxidoreductase (luciferase family)
MTKYGRKPNELLLMPGISVVVGKTEAEARDQHEFLQSQIHPDVGLALLSAELGNADLAGLGPDELFPIEAIPSVGVSRTTIDNLTALVEKERPTVRELYERYSGARGSYQIIGTASQIADNLEHWFRSGAADGFIIQPAIFPTGLSDFVDLVVPELQRREIYRQDYEGTMLRDHLGLARPLSRYHPEHKS